MLTRRSFATLLPIPALSAAPANQIVLTFDDAVKSHLTNVAPLLKELGFQATFFISHRWMDDHQHFLTWPEVAQIHTMGFEIGNHSWTHASFNTPKAAARLEAELALVNGELRKAGVPKPISFAWCGNAFGPEALAELQRLGYQFARRGMQPELPYGQIQVGPAYDPTRHDRLLIPTTGDAYPQWTVEHFEKVIAQSAPGRIVILQFHGVPDVKHPWVHTPPEQFEKYMRLLKAKGFTGIALRDLASVARSLPQDPTRALRYPIPKDGVLAKPLAEAHPLPIPNGRQTRLAPYPGHEHPRTGFLDGAIAPYRGTKAMAFLPWDPDSYVVIDVPEAIFAGRRLLFLAHTHIPSIWDERNMILEDRDWTVTTDGLNTRWTLPDTLNFAASLTPSKGNAIELYLEVTNRTTERWTNLRSQVCIMLKRAAGFHQQTNDNKILGPSIARVRGPDGARAIAVEWENTQRTWANSNCPCLHSDPLLPDCNPGETVNVRGRLWFEG